MAQMSETTIASPIELAELAARALEGIAYLGRFRKTEECRSELEAGINLCNILIEGRGLENSLKSLQTKDVPVWRAFQKVREGVTLNADVFEQVASEAVPVQTGLTSIVGGKPAQTGELKNYRRFFFRVAASLGL
jgi:hypothetical protein